MVLENTLNEHASLWKGNKSIGMLIACSIRGGDGGDIVHVQDELRLHRVRWNFRLVYGFDDSEVTLVTSSFSLLSKPILYLFQIQWAFH